MPRRIVSGGPTVHLTLRLQRDIYEKLQRVAGEAGMAEEIRSRLAASFVDRAFSQNPKTQDLAAAISDLADGIQREFGDWSADPFSYEAFMAGLRIILAACRRPEGEAKPKPNPKGIADVLFSENPTPEEVGRGLAPAALFAKRGAL